MQRIVEKRWRRRASTQLAKWLSDKRVSHALEALDVPDEGLGYDRFGVERESYELSMATFRWLYTHYFRVASAGVDGLPSETPLIFATNHAGLVPTGAAMIMVDLVCAPKPIMVRPVVGRYLASLPYLNIMLSRTGSVFASSSNLDALVGGGQSILTFPEGSRAIGKPFARRSRLLSFKTFVVDLSLKHRIPIIPVGVVGVEEQAPVLATLDVLGKEHDGPRFPVTPTFPFLGPAGLLPLPSRVSIKYGAPLRLYEETDGQVVAPTTSRTYTDQLQSRVQGLVDQLNEEREGVFR